MNSKTAMALVALLSVSYLLSASCHVEEPERDLKVSDDDVGALLHSEVDEGTLFRRKLAGSSIQGNRCTYDGTGTDPCGRGKTCAQTCGSVGTGGCSCVKTTKVCFGPTCSATALVLCADYGSVCLDPES